MDIDITKNNYFQDILQQPKAIKDTYEYLLRKGPAIFQENGVKIDEYKQIVLTGMGSSFFALYPLYYRLIEQNIPVVMMETSELIHYGTGLMDENQLFVVVSQSGSSAEVLRFFNKLPVDVDVIAVTNQPDSVLAEKSNWIVPLQAGDEFSVSCKTYLATLVGLLWLGDEMCPQSNKLFQGLGEILPDMKSYLHECHSHIDTFRADFANITDLFLIGRGDSLANVYTGGLIIKESAHFHAEGMSSAAYRHGPMEILGANVMTMIMEGGEETKSLNQQMANEIQNKHFPVIYLSSDASNQSYRLPSVKDGYRHLVEMLPIQMASIAIALNHNHDPGVFSIGSKVTSKE